MYVIYEQNIDEVVFKKICRQDNAILALSEIGKERLEVLKKQFPEVWFVGVSVDYTFDNVINSPNKDNLYLNQVRMKFHKRVEGHSENFEELLYMTSVESFEKSNGLSVTVERPSVLTERQQNALAQVYGKLWIEANYDPESESLRKFAAPLSKIMQELNKELHFKK